MSFVNSCHLEIQIAFAKYLTRPGLRAFSGRCTLNHQVTGRPAHRRQLFLGSMAFRDEAQVDVDRLTSLFSRLNCGFWGVFFPPSPRLATGLHLAEYVWPYLG